MGIAYPQDLIKEWSGNFTKIQVTSIEGATPFYVGFQLNATKFKHWLKFQYSMKLASYHRKARGKLEAVR
jgi:hypothetical protein